MHRLSDEAVPGEIPDQTDRVGVGQTGLGHAAPGARSFIDRLIEDLCRCPLVHGRELVERQRRRYRQDIGVDGFQKQRLAGLHFPDRVGVGQIGREQVLVRHQT
jgi:hypothetical protein